MKTKPLITAFASALVALSAVTAIAAPEKDAKEKRAGTIDYPFWSSKKRPDSPAFVPGLNAVLDLTAAQQEQISAARSEAMNDEGAKAARASKGDPSMTPEQKEKARAAMDAASAKLRDKVAAILTPEQKALIAKINSAYADTVEEIGTIYNDKFASVKAAEAARKRIQEEKAQDTTDQFLHKLDSILTPAQKDAMTKAGEEEKKEAAQSASAAAKKAAK